MDAFLRELFGQEQAEADLRQAASRYAPSGLSAALMREIAPLLPGEDPADHIGALVAVDVDEVQITLVARTEAGRRALAELTQEGGGNA